MSHVEKEIPLVDYLDRPRMNKPLAYAAAASFIIRVAKLHDRFRDTLPEPIDIADHLGNIDISIGLGVLSTKILADRLRDQRNALVLGFAAVSVVNVVTETKWGTKVLPVLPGIQHGEGASPNMIDAAYGVGSAAIGARFALRRQKQSQ